MIYYETLLIGFIFLTILSIVVSFLIKIKPIRYFLWMISFSLLILTLSTINKHSADINAQTKKFLGLYRIDLQKSHYGDVDLQRYKNLLLTVKNDNSFNFNKSPSPFLYRAGKWKFQYNEDGGYLQCYFNNKEINSFVSADNSVWIFKYDCLENGSMDDIIYFNRMQK